MGSFTTRITRNKRDKKTPTPAPLVSARLAPVATPGANTGLLPPPRVPSPRYIDKADVIASVVGEDLVAPMRRVQDVIQAAQAAVVHLEAHRPGPLGSEWKAAMAADFADYAAGNIPSEYRTAAITKTDPDRWAAAQMACRYVPVAAEECARDLNANAIRKAADSVSNLAGKEFAKVIAQGWKSRDDRSEAWKHRTRAEELLSRYQTARNVAYWAAGQLDNPEDDKVADYPTPESKGHWLALDLFLHPQKRMLRVPRDIVWPEGSDRVIGLGQVFLHAPGIDPELGGHRELEGVE